jgi:class 3 adenylate cyclase/predicted ATPase
MDVARWLADHGLGHHAEAFRENGIAADVLRDLTDADFKELGLNLGDRKRLLKAIAALDAVPATRPAEVAAPPVTPPHPREAERRQLTVMFVDLVGSTALSARLDPEETREVLGAYQHAVASELTRLEGHVAKFMGDGVLAYIGWPKAHEDDAERAVRSGLAIVEAVARLTTPSGETLAARVGIATGLVVVGDLIGEGAAQEEAVVGDTPNLAARLQMLAEPGAVIIAESTRRLVGALFRLDELKSVAVKGVAGTASAYRVLGASAIEGRFDALRASGMAPLLGREQELALLLERWQQAKDGEGQVVSLCGEPGIGKSRIVLALRERVRQEPRTRMRYHCSPHHTHSALYPVIEQLERAAGFAREDTPEVRLAKLESVLREAMAEVDEMVPLIAALLLVPAGERYPPLALTPQEQKARLFAALLAQLEGLAAQKPVLMILEDAHWLDPTSLELFSLTVDRLARLRVLLVVTYRPEFTPPWGGQPHVTTLTLNRLGRRHGAALIESVTHGRPLPVMVIEQILARTDGVPLFVEELTKAVLESGLLEDQGDRYALVGGLPPLAIPSTLHDSLLARLDRLAPVKEVAQIGAAIGREFSHELLAAVAPLGDRELRDAVSRLVEAELIFRRGTPPQATYTFKHALVQDAAYQSLLKSRRQQLHARIVSVLRERFPEAVAAEPELMARHCTEAGLATEAVPYLVKAGRQALRRSANAEAVEHLSKGLALLQALPAGSDQEAAELDLLVALGPPLIAIKGFTDPEVEKTYLRARALCQKLGDATQLVPVLVGLANIHLLRAELRQARELGEECLALAQEHDEPAAQIAAHRMLGAALHFLGDFPEARVQLEQANAVHERHPCRGDASLHLVSGSRVYCRSILARVLWVLGYPEQALRTSHEALRLAGETCHRHTLAQALSLAAAFHLDRRDVQQTERLAGDAVALAVEHDFPYWRATGRVWQGWAFVQRQRTEEGLAQIQQSLAHFRARGDLQTIPHALIVLAEVQGQIGAPDKGLEALAEALAVLETTNERRREAEIHRLRGELLLLLPGRHREEAEACLERALAVARRQSARMWELRAASSLARLWAGRGHRDSGHRLLAPIYSRFTEGFDTTDLIEAKQLLEALT